MQSARKMEEISDHAAEGEETQRREGESRRWHSEKREEISSVPPMVVKGERCEIRAVALRGYGRCRQSRVWERLRLTGVEGKRKRTE